MPTRLQVRFPISTGRAVQHDDTFEVLDRLVVARDVGNQKHLLATGRDSDPVQVVGGQLLVREVLGDRFPKLVRVKLRDEVVHLCEDAVLGYR
jgi:hypothetical protein